MVVMVIMMRIKNPSDTLVMMMKTCLVMVHTFKVHLFFTLGEEVSQSLCEFRVPETVWYRGKGGHQLEAFLQAGDPHHRKGSG